jgi:hypothetical protein
LKRLWEHRRNWTFCPLTHIKKDIMEGGGGGGEAEDEEAEAV